MAETTGSAAVARWLRMARELLPCVRDLRRTLELGAVAAELSDLELLLLASCGASPSEGQNQSLWAAELGLSNAHVSQLVEGLRKRGWMVGQRAANDRRRQVWRLTEEGRERLTQAVAQLTPLLTHLDMLFSASEAESLAAQLSRLAAALTQVCTSAAGTNAAATPRSAIIDRREAA